MDSERILTQLKVEGYQIVPSYGEADAVVVNTCGFIDAAVQESLDSIGTALNENGKVIVTGCLGKREALIREAYPDVLSISGPQDYASVMSAVRAALLPPVRNKFIDIVPDTGVKLTPKHYAYLKISKAATTAAASASSRRCAATWSRARSTRCWSRPRSWSRAA
ncbi:hypothetical protein [Rhodanobacter lindaniclasticus]